MLLWHNSLAPNVVRVGWNPHTHTYIQATCITAQEHGEGGKRKSWFRGIDLERVRGKIRKLRRSDRESIEVKASFLSSLPPPSQTNRKSGHRYGLTGD